jgi:hypothetical protein
MRLHGPVDRWHVDVATVDIGPADDHVPSTVSASTSFDTRDPSHIADTIGGMHCIVA